MDAEPQSPGRTRSPFEDLRRAVMARLRELDFKTTGGVARLLADGNAGVIEFQKSGRSTPHDTTFTLNVGIALGALLPGTNKKPLSHCSVAECHARLRLGELREPPSDLWWTLVNGSEGAGELPKVLGEVLERVETDAVPLVRRYTAAGALAALWESGSSLGTTPAQRKDFLRRLGTNPGTPEATPTDAPTAPPSTPLAW